MAGPLAAPSPLVDFFEPPRLAPAAPEPWSDMLGLHDGQNRATGQQAGPDEVGLAA